MSTMTREEAIEADIKSLNERLDRAERDMLLLQNIHLNETHSNLNERLEELDMAESIDITPLCKAISDMTEELSNTIGKETVRASIEKRIDAMIEILDKYVNGEKK